MLVEFKMYMLFFWLDNKAKENNSRKLYVSNFTVPPSVTTVQPLPVVVGTTIVLVCDVTGVDPPDTITWTFSGMNVSTNNNFTLTISNADYGVYTCTGSNEFGSDNSSVMIIQAGMCTFPYEVHIMLN